MFGYEKTSQNLTAANLSLEMPSKTSEFEEQSEIFKCAKKNARQFLCLRNNQNSTVLQQFDIHYSELPKLVIIGKLNGKFAAG